MRKTIYLINNIGTVYSSDAQLNKIPSKLGRVVVTYKVENIKSGKEEGTIDKEFFKKILAEKPSNIFLVDVRTPFEYKAGHLDGAKHSIYKRSI